MGSIQLGDFALETRSLGVCVTLNGDRQNSVVIPTQQVGALVEFLDQHCREERRVGFRVPLQPLSDSMQEALEVSVACSKDSVPAELVDLSLTGALLDMQPSNLRAGQSVPVTLRLGDESVTLLGKIVRCDGRLVALHFSSCVKDGELDPAPVLLAIYRSLELNWLKARTAGD